MSDSSNVLYRQFPIQWMPEVEEISIPYKEEKAVKCFFLNENLS